MKRICCNIALIFSHLWPFATSAHAFLTLIATHIFTPNMFIHIKVLIFQHPKTKTQTPFINLFDKAKGKGNGVCWFVWQPMFDGGVQ